MNLRSKLTGDKTETPIGGMNTISSVKKRVVVDKKLKTTRNVQTRLNKSNASEKSKENVQTVVRSTRSSENKRKNANTSTVDSDNVNNTTKSSTQVPKTTKSSPKVPKAKKKENNREPSIGRHSLRKSQTTEEENLSVNVVNPVEMNKPKENSPLKKKEKSVIKKVVRKSPRKSVANLEVERKTRKSATKALSPVENIETKPPKSQSNEKQVEKKPTKKTVKVTVRKSPRKPVTPAEKVESSVESHKVQSEKQPTRQLRRQTPLNYVETTLNNTSNAPSPQRSEKIPIYKKLPTNEEPKRVKDPYELDIPIEKKQELDDSSKYDKKMHEIMQNIIRRVEKKKKPAKNKKKLNPKAKSNNNVPVQAKSAVTSTPNTSKNDVLILSDVQVNNPNLVNLHLTNLQTPIPTHTSTPTLQNEVRVIETPGNLDTPKANRTAIESEAHTSTPWRFPSEMIIYNPHFMKLKDTALPAINQEAIIDYRLEESHRSHVTPPQNETTFRKSPVQTSILDYVKLPNNSALQTRQNVTISYSLFDADQLSPIKVRPSVEMKENVRRNILIESNQQHSPDRRSLFGFNQMDEENTVENKENSPKSPIKRPFRLDLKQYIKKSAIKQIEVEDDDIEEETLEPEDSLEEETVTEIHEVRLFDDPEDMFNQHPPNLAKKRRRPRHLSTASEGDDMPRKKKKDVFTKEEEEAFDKWANEFNSMCDEIEKHELEVE